MAMIWVGTSPTNLVECPTPSSMDWGLQDVSAADSGRTDDTKMHKNRIGQKVKWSLVWMTKKPDVVSTILQLFDPEYIYVRYSDPKHNRLVTKEFYVGDRSAPVKQWVVGGRLYESVSFDIIER